MNTCPIRDVLARVADRWNMLVLSALARNGTLRFSALKVRIEDISLRMLAQALRQFEQDGFLSRTVRPTNPPLTSRVVIIVIAGIALSGCNGGIFHPRGPVGAADRLILVDSLAIKMVIGLPTILATLAFAWWFRASNRLARYRSTWVYSERLEVIVWVIPALVVLFLGGIAWIGSHDLDPYQRLDSSNLPLEVEVVSMDCKWLFIYPDQGIASVNELIVPAGRPVHFRLTSATVMNSFFIPQLGSQIYTMPGMIT
jgi:cytochrome o ubiquinol oxidase subunit II